jgi:3-carboxy-cis,cis-muconate cycloisomerase
MSQRGLFGGVFARGAVVIDDTAWLAALLAVEAALARALERAGLAPPGSGAAVTAVAVPENFDADELGELAARTGNPVPALVRQLTEQVAGTARKAAGQDEMARAVHRGATSQDIIDTAIMLLARQVIDAVAADLDTASDAAARLADTHRGTLMIGRTLLQQAVPVTFGLVAAGWLNGLDEARAGLITARSGLAIQFGGAAGTLASLGDEGPLVARLMAEELGLTVPALPWHTQRLRVIDAATALARVTSVAGKIARDVTLLAQTEVGELAETVPGGSSAMPHKRNPATAVAILGGTRQVPGLLATIVASAEQEQQRAAGAWHAEWQPLGHLFTLASSVAAQTSALLNTLVVDAQRMRANLAATAGNTLAEYAATLLGGGPAARDRIRDAVASGVPLRDVIGRELDPAGYLGAAGEFIDAAIAAHKGGDNG